MTKVAINGFGRIGRLVARAILERDDHGLELVAINDLADAKSNAMLFKRDSVHGKFPGEIDYDDSSITVNGKRIAVTSERDPAKLPHKDLGVEIALECTGFFADREGGQKHLDAGAKRVLISAPAKGVDLTVVYGVDHDKLTADHTIVSNASCTTNCLAPVAKVLHETFGVKRGLMTTVHAYTNDQRILDLPHEDLRRARAAALSMIPTSTGAAKAIGLVIPALDGKLDGMAVRVPTPNVSLVDLCCEVDKPATKDAINAAIKEAAAGPLKGVLLYCDEPLVSADFNHSPYSSIFDSALTKVIDGNFLKVLSWYDNEWGFSHRVVDALMMMV